VQALACPRRLRLPLNSALSERRGTMPVLKRLVLLRRKTDRLYLIILVGIILLFVSNGLFNHVDDNVKEHNSSIPEENFTLGHQAVLKLTDEKNLEFIWIRALQMWVGKYEITLGQYEVFYPHATTSSWKTYKDMRYVNKRLSPVEEEQMRTHPVGMISWKEAKKYCDRLNKIYKKQLPEGYAFRLPTEAEWEAFARCGDDRIYPWGNEWPPQRMKDGIYPNYQGDESLFKSKGRSCRIPDYKDGWKSTCPVQKSGMNDWGLYGVGGNVREWCESWYDRGKGLRSLKGGSFLYWLAEISRRSNISRSSWYIPVLSWFNNKVKKNHGCIDTGFRVVIGLKY
jgi:formylglycine-generating enzyme required for sulfatase activity